MAGTKKFSSDLVLIADLVLLTDIFMLVPVLSGNFLYTTLGMPILLFLLGYALIATLPLAKADNYPTQYLMGEHGTVVVGVTNHRYRYIDHTIDKTLEPFRLLLPFEGNNLKFEFLLFNETKKSAPYRDLHLWIDVIKKAGEI